MFLELLSPFLLSRGHSAGASDRGVVAFIDELGILSHGNRVVVREELAVAEVLKTIKNQILPKGQEIHNLPIGQSGIAGHPVDAVGD
jgi:hypothetical protein